MAENNLEELRNAQVPVDVLYECKILDCPYRAIHIRRLVDHMVFYHGNIRHPYLKCRVGNCACRHSMPESFRVHVIRQHRAEWDTFPILRINRQNIENVEEIVEYGRDLAEFGDVEVLDEDSSQMYTGTRDWVATRSLDLRLAMEHLYEVPSSTVMQLHRSVSNFITSMHMRLQETVSKRLLELGMHDEALSGYVCAAEVMDALRVTKSRAKKRLLEMSYVEPKRIRLSLPDNRSTEADRSPDRDLEDDVHEEAPDSSAFAPDDVDEVTVEAEENPYNACGVMHYVPILKTLEAYLKHDSVVASIRAEEAAPHLAKYNSAGLFQVHPFFKDHPEALRLILYMDELELCNPLGSRRGKHKVTVAYFSVGNIEQHYLSSLSSIHLVLVCRHPNVKKYGYNVILKPLIEDLQKLQTTGINVVTHGGEQCHWLGSVAFLCGDSLTLNAVGCFRGTFSSGRVCRFCMADYSQLGTLLSEASCRMRTREEHEYHVNSVLQDPQLAAAYGVTGRSPFAELNIGAPFEFCSPDLLHDVLEGLMSMHVTNIIRQLHRDKVVRLNTIINATGNFKYGKVDKQNKPPPISPMFNRAKSHLIGTGSQRWTLFHILPLAIGHLVPEGNEHWQLFLLSTEIFEIVMAPVVKVEWVYALQQLIERHHTLWTQLYPGKTTYKWHVLLHYPRFLLLLGSMRNFWTMRFEAFHQFFKRVASKVRNFRCISRTMSFRFQRKRCVQLELEGALPPEVVLIGRQLSVTVGSFSARDRLLLMEHFECCEDKKVLKVREMKWRGHHLIPGCFVVMSVSGAEIPVFLKIRSLVVIDDIHLVLGTLSYVVAWDQHRRAYKVQVSSEPDDCVCVPANRIQTWQTIDGYKLDGELFLKLRYLPV